MSIHPTAIVHPEAVLGDGVEIGPYSIVEAGARIGSQVRIAAHCLVTGAVEIGTGCELHQGVVVGHEPQDRSWSRDIESGVQIGGGTILREYATVHRASLPGGKTTIGRACYLMSSSHVAHDCRLGDGVTLCNNALLAGHVEVGDRAFISGNVVVHQFSRIGELVMLGGGCQVGRDVPPFTMVTGRSEIRGLNTIGMRRAYLSAEDRLAVKETYRAIFAEPGDLARARQLLDEPGDSEIRRRIRDFYAASSRRGFCWPPRGNAEEAE